MRAPVLGSAVRHRPATQYECLMQAGLCQALTTGLTSLQKEAARWPELEQQASIGGLISNPWPDEGGQHLSRNQMLCGAMQN